MITIYLASVGMAAIFRGYFTPASDVSIDGVPTLVLVAFFWPIIVLAGFGQACRMFSVKRIAEDGGAPWVDRP